MKEKRVGDGGASAHGVFLKQHLPVFYCCVCMCVLRVFGFKKRKHEAKWNRRLSPAPAKASIVIVSTVFGSHTLYQHTVVRQYQWRMPETRELIHVWHVCGYSLALEYIEKPQDIRVVHALGVSTPGSVIPCCTSVRV